MQAVSFGYVKAALSGVPVTMASVLATLGLPADLKVAELSFFPLVANTGLAFVGLDVTAPQAKGVAMNTTTGVNTLKQVQAASAGKQDFVSISSSKNSNDVRVADYAMTATVAGEGFSVTGYIN
jgi:hypothetical protein